MTLGGSWDCSRVTLAITFDEFTDRARRVLVLTQEEARLLNHAFIGTEHILLGLIAEGEGLAAKALAGLGIELQAARDRVEEVIGQSGTDPTGTPTFTPRAKKVLELSLRESLRLGHNYIGTEHILLGIVADGEVVSLLGIVEEEEGVGAKVLVSLGADLSSVRQQVMLMLQGYQGATVERPATPRISNPKALMRDPGRTTSVERSGKEWTARVVRPGRGPTDYAEAYEDLAELVAEHGIELDDVEPGRLVVTSVDTYEGPGLAVSLSCRVEPMTQ
jgi:ClpA/ClpB-like protein